MEATPQDNPAGNPPEIEERILVALRRIIRAIELHSRDLLDSSGLTGPQLAALTEVARAGGLSAGALAHALRVGQPTVTGIVERLERRGLLIRSRNDVDRRSVDIAITDDGRRLLTAAPPLLQERFRQRLARLQDWERSQILTILQRIAAMMDVEELAASPHLVTGPEQL